MTLCGKRRAISSQSPAGFSLAVAHAVIGILEGQADEVGESVLRHVRSGSLAEVPIGRP